MSISMLRWEALQECSSGRSKGRRETSRVSQFKMETELISAVKGPVSWWFFRSIYDQRRML